eukprot:1913444-Amphidinium_carterae.1
MIWLLSKSLSPVFQWECNVPRHSEMRAIAGICTTEQLQIKPLATKRYALHALVPHGPNYALLQPATAK